DERGRAATHEHRRRRRQVGGRDLATARRDVVVVEVVTISPRRERAVVAALGTERNVYVDAERIHVPGWAVLRADGHTELVEAAAHDRRSRLEQERERPQVVTSD